ncbi:MAG: outer membrane beta-barrel protein, partial [Verrucomicrobia bacterium]|nr:outer membrane beta-barrel protein [Verrucomicrobiota bacterium]
GFVGGAQLGYTFQWGRLVIGPEADLGYMNVHGSGAYPGSIDTRGESSSDFYTTLRGRVGIALDHNWLIYATGGAIGLNSSTRVVDDSLIPGGGLVDTSSKDFIWGYTVGGGIEHAINRHWSIKLEYLYFAFDNQTSTGVATTPDFGTFRFDTETKGHIIRAGVNYRF